MHFQSFYQQARALIQFTLGKGSRLQARNWVSKAWELQVPLVTWCPQGVLLHFVYLASWFAFMLRFFLRMQVERIVLLMGTNNTLPFANDKRLKVTKRDCIRFAMDNTPRSLAPTT